MMMSSATRTPKITLSIPIWMALALMAVSVNGGFTVASPSSMAIVDPAAAASNGVNDQKHGPPPPPPMMVMAAAEEESKTEEAGSDDQEERLNIDEPFLWQMAAFAARQMSDKRLKFKLMTLTSADKFDESTYRLQLTLKRIKIDEPMSKNDVMYCTVEVIDYQQNWSLDNFGCSLPAMVRTRERSNTIRSSSGGGGDKLDTILESSSSSSSSPLSSSSIVSSPSLPSSPSSSSSAMQKTPSSMFMMMIPQPQPPTLLPIMQAFNYHPNEIIDHQPQLTDYQRKPLMDNGIDLGYGQKPTFKSLPQAMMAPPTHHPQPGQTFMYPSNPFPYRPQASYRSYQEYRPYYKFYY